MERQSQTRIRYLNIDEMFLRIDKLRSERELSEAQAAQSTDYVAQFERWALAESTAAPWMQPAQTAELAQKSARTERFADPTYVWMGDDMAVHLEAADPSELDDDMDADFDRDTASKEPWRDAPTGFLAKWGLERYALGATAVGIIALLIAGTAFRTGPNDTLNSLAMTTLSAGRDPYNEVAIDENVTAMPSGQIEVAAISPRRQAPTPDEVDERVHQALSDQGFWDIGVSAGSRGDIYLAGDVYSMDEAKYVMAVARHATHAASVFFLHPEVLPAEGPAYFGAAADYAPAVWGAKISYVAIGSPAYMAGVRAGDVIRGFDGKMVADADDLQKAVSAHQPGQRIQIRVWRDDANQFLVARLTTKPRTEVAMR